jgi:hypothetical protein
MWAKLDDGLLDHWKVLEAARAFGKNGRAIALGFYASGLLYTQKHLTDGFLSVAMIEEMRVVDRPKDAAEIMVRVGFWEAVDGGYRIHDFHDHNPSASDIIDKRRKDNARKKEWYARRNGHP